MADIPGADQCGRCGAAILWTITERGKRMPVDYRADPDGTVDVSSDGTTRRSRVLTGMELAARRDADDVPTLHKAHFATCPNPPPRRPR